MKIQLHLTPQQEVVVDKELDDYAKYYQNIQEEKEDVAELGMRKILEVLTPQQRQTFRRLVKSDPLLGTHPSR